MVGGLGAQGSRWHEFQPKSQRARDGEGPKFQSESEGRERLSQLLRQAGGVEFCPTSPCGAKAATILSWFRQDTEEAAGPRQGLGEAAEVGLGGALPRVWT